MYDISIILFCPGRQFLEKVRQSTPGMKYISSIATKFEALSDALSLLILRIARS